MPATYEPLATTTLGSDTTQIDFTSIPSTYTDIMVVLTGGMNTTTGYAVAVRFNSDTGTNYSVTRLEGNGSSASSYRSSNVNQIYTGVPAKNTLNSTHIFVVNNYSNSTTYKTLLNRSNSAAEFVFACVGLWRSTSAITTFSLCPEFGSGAKFLSGTTATLYGIKAA